MRTVLIGLMALAIACGDDDGADLDAFVVDDAGVEPSDATPATDASEPDAFAEDLGPEPDAFVPSCEPGGLGPGDVELTLDHDGLTRRYFVHVPDDYDASEPVPLVFDFHGYSSNATQEISLTDMNDLADDEGFIAVHPEGTGALQSWNAGLCCATAMSGDVDDVGFVRAMLEAVASMACVDRSRVYATGMSNGGFLSHRLACEASDIIAAIAPVAGVIGMPMDECAPPRPVPVMHFHGTFDTIVPYGGGTASGFPSVAETIAHWASRNGCTDEAASTYDMGDSHCETFDECEGGSEVTLCTVDGGGHLWPGGLGSFSTIDATEHMWAFLSRFTL